MLQSLLPKAHPKSLALPLLGSIADGFDDWLAMNGYTRGSRKFAIRMLPHVDADLRRRKVRAIPALTHSTLHASWRHLMKRFPTNAGTVRSLERYLTATGVITADDGAVVRSATAMLSDEYADYLRDVRGLAVSSLTHHRRASRSFLDHLEVRRISIASIRPQDVEGYVSQAGKRLCRGSLQHEIAALRGLLRFLATDGRAAPGLDKQIDTPRLYRLEQLPRALPWPTVIELLRSIDVTSAIGLRDYAIFILIATYGLRASEVVALSLDDVAWRKGVLRIHQRKTASPLELPLTNEVSAALVKHLKRNTPPAPYRSIFLRMRAPMGLLKPTAITEAFQSLVRRSGLDIPFEGPHCLRHSFAVHLLKNGTPLKTIGDILGHRTAESTSMYLRLATGDLREVSLAVPGKGSAAKAVRP
ncbi:MAG: tyrosine-type recombinase/integrase [Candidatus Sulfotelmatobacter sp.]